ncbi:hypothetical protein WMF45_29675 [Sorangium sp. So ce448]|uniref:hypothetical protein n=1 Tax=Sorangium sp. So ce448 TaxID=3133314 RepID=UPI003F5E33FC
MLSTRFIAIGLLGACVFTAGCAASSDTGPDAPSDTDPVETAELPIRSTAVPIGCNGLLPSDFWAPENRTALRALGQRALAGANDVVAPTALLGTSGGKSVLDYTVRCALSSDQVVHGPDGRAFHGSFGFAPAWTERALTSSEQRWVSACIFQHLNGTGEHVEFLPQGSHPALDGPLNEEPYTEFVVHDATMYGNAFLSGAIAGYACIDPDLTGELSALSLSCPLDLSLLSLERLCGHVPTCGIAFLGLCDLTCLEDVTGNQTCHTLPLLGPLLGSLLGPSYSETIRSEVRDSDLLPLYNGCGLL